MKPQVVSVVKGNIIAKFKTSSRESVIPFSALKKYWDYADEDDIEGGNMIPLNDGNILIFFTTASDQGGVVFIWDTEKDEIVHVSEGAYTIAASIYKGEVFTLRYIHYWGITPYLAWSKAPAKTMDAWSETEIHKIEGIDYCEGPISLTVDELGIHIDNNGTVTTCKI